MSSSQRCNIDNLLSDKTKAEGLLFLAEKNNIPKFEDIVKFTRSLELIYKSERNEEYEKNNHLSFIAVSTLYGNKGRVATIGSMYFEGKTLETIQNIFLAKRNDFGRISYLDSYVSTLPIQDDLKTSVFLEQKPTIVEKIKADENIEETFYEAINVLKEFTVKSKEIKKQNLLLEPKKVFDSVQELAVKIILTLDIKGTSVDQKRGYSERFVRDLYNVIVDYKEVEELKNLKFEPNMKRLNSMTTVIENKDKLVKTLEKNMNLHQKNREDVFIREFERINKEIDLLDKRADELGKKLAKGATNEAIEEIALEQHKKFLELQNLQNKRLKELKEDVENGIITEFYFNKRTEQVKLLSDIKNKPAMFMCDDKNYKNFKTYVKEVLKKDIKSFDQNQLRFNENKYDLLMRKSKDEKQLHLINKILTHYKLSTNKSINYERVEQIVVKDNTFEMKKISEELLESNRQIEEAKKNPQKAPLEVNLEEPNEEVSEEIIKEEVKVVVVKKDS